MAVYDVATAQSQELITHIKGNVQIETDLPAAIKRYHLVFDATPAKNIIGADAVSAKTLVAAPGMP